MRDACSNSCFAVVVFVFDCYPADFLEGSQNANANVVVVVIVVVVVAVVVAVVTFVAAAAATAAALVDGADGVAVGDFVGVADVAAVVVVAVVGVSVVLLSCVIVVACGGTDPFSVNADGSKAFRCVACVVSFLLLFVQSLMVAAV